MSCAALRNLPNEAAVLPIVEPPLPRNTCGNRRARRRAIAERELFANRQLAVRSIVRTPSVFTALNGRQAEENCFSMGFQDVLGSANQPYANGKTTAGLGGLPGGGKVCAQLVGCGVNLNASNRPPNAAYRTPSLFDCTTASCQASFCYENGFTDQLPTVQQSQRNSGCTAGLGGLPGGGKTFGNLCTRVTRFGPTSA